MKRRKLRGSKTAGRGNGQNARKAGSHAGVGRAGSGKRGQQKINTFDIRKETEKKKEKKYPLNLNVLEQKVEEWANAGKIEKKGEMYVIDVKKLGYTKVCGKLNKQIKLEIHGPCSESAKQSILSFGGQVYE